MKRTIAMLCMCVCVAAVLPAQASRGGTMYVTPRTLDLKSSTGIFASTRGRLEYGAQVTVLQVSGAWVEVRSATNASVSGWTKTVNLTPRRIVQGSGTGASAQEVALAGKGFNQEIERAYRTEGNLSYDAVDMVETLRVSDTDLQAFLVEGRLSMGE